MNKADKKWFSNHIINSIDEFEILHWDITTTEDYRKFLNYLYRLSLEQDKYIETINKI